MSIDTLEIIDNNRSRGGSWEYETRERGGRIVLYLHNGTSLTLTVDRPENCGECWLDNAAGQSIPARGHVDHQPMPVDSVHDLFEILKVAYAVDTLCL
tara:strand:+ start:670 stop:963 length:294 start_codon:yes stop_codon:yes gene_type:complete